MVGKIVQLEEIVLSPVVSERLEAFVRDLHQKLDGKRWVVNLPPTKARMEEGQLFVFVSSSYPSGGSLTSELFIPHELWRWKEGSH